MSSYFDGRTTSAIHARSGFGQPIFNANLGSTRPRSDFYVEEEYKPKVHSTKSILSTLTKNAWLNISNKPLIDVKMNDMQKKIDLYKKRIRKDTLGKLTDNKIRGLIKARKDAHDARLAYYANDYNYDNKKIDERLYVANETKLKKNLVSKVRIEEEAIEEIKSLIETARKDEERIIKFYFDKKDIYDIEEERNRYRNSGLVIDEIIEERNLNALLIPATLPGVSLGGAKRPVAKRPVAKRPVAKRPVAKRPVAKRPVAKRPVAKRPVAKRPVAKRA